MAYRFKHGERFAKGLRRIGEEQLGRACAQLRRGEAGAAVHATRKAIKRLRALLRLVRSGLSATAYRELNTGLGDAGRTLSATRDRDVVQATIAKLAGEFPQARSDLLRLGRHLQGDPGHADPGTVRAARAQALAELSEAQVEWVSLDLDGDGFEVIAAGLERGLQDLARAHEAASGSSSDGDESFHDLRKAVQRHWRHMRLVEAGWPEYFAARAGEARAVSDVLGRAQDLTVLLGTIERHGATALKAERVEALTKLVHDRRDELRAAAVARCARLAAEGPRAHARRAAAFWSTAAAIHDAATAEGAPPRPDKGASSGVQQAPARAVRPPRKRSARVKPVAKPKRTARR